MGQVLRLGLVLAALLGLFAQTTAFAAGPFFAAAIQNATAETMPIDCPETMEDRGESSLPCEQMTLGCIAAMGCMTVFTLDNRGTAVASTTPLDSLTCWALLAALQGRSVEPEPHPPSTLDR